MAAIISIISFMVFLVCVSFLIGAQYGRRQVGWSTRDEFLCGYQGGCGSRLNGKCERIVKCDKWVPYKKPCMLSRHWM
jgi:hypothetical protein